MNVVPRWASDTFDLILHAEMHRLDGEDFDRKIAFINFDNSIEASITTYLTLHPVQRQGREYEKEKVNGWLKNYHTKLNFLDAEIEQRKSKKEIDNKDIIYCHSIRNRLYHEGNYGVPNESDLMEIRRIALWIFSFLFNVVDIEQILDDKIQEIKNKNTQPNRDIQFDELIDKQYSEIEVVGQPYKTSDLLFFTDYNAYLELGKELVDESQLLNSRKEEDK